MFEKLKKLIEKAKKKVAHAVDPEVFNHPLAQQTEWYPLKGGGTNFQTHRLDSSNPAFLRCFCLGWPHRYGHSHGDFF